MRLSSKTSTSTRPTESLLSTWWFRRQMRVQLWKLIRICFFGRHYLSDGDHGASLSTSSPHRPLAWQVIANAIICSVGVGESLSNDRARFMATEMNVVQAGLAAIYHFWMCVVCWVDLEHRSHGYCSGHRQISYLLGCVQSSVRIRNVSSLRPACYACKADASFPASSLSFLSTIPSHLAFGSSFYGSAYFL